MMPQQEPDHLEELKTLQRELDRLLDLRVAARKEQFSLKDRAELARLLILSQRKSGWAAPLVADLTGLSTLTVRDREFDMWAVAVRVKFDKYTLDALLKCSLATNRAIGKMDSDIRSGIRDERGNKLIKETGTPPKCFVSHGKPSKALDKIEEFLRAVGVEPLIVKKEASRDKYVGQKVDYYLAQSDCVIILATGDDKVEGGLQPRQNVIHEVGLAQERHPGKVIYLLEEGAVFPSNIGGKVWEPFNQKCMENVFLCIARELRAFGIVRTVGIRSAG